ncbi:GDSL-type esterase/lipase family protein [Nocardioides lijunqiniae]|uniref:GDSL-type esterase/lipase family protein n=1 Tax=Nocardioides lijunqiniae TaxID=2760832 RepID=UPI001878B848
MLTRLARPARAALLALAALATTSALLVAPPAQAAGPAYVALGDSYSSGTGTRSYIADGTSCQRSTYAYPSLVAAARGYALNFRACSGAKIADVTSTQLGALSATTRYVTLSVGGNDADFTGVLTECATPWWAGDCDGAIDTAQAFIRTTLPGRLTTLYSSIRSRASSAKVVVVGYPRIFQGEDCNALTWFSPAEETRLNQTADLLNSKLAAAASARGFAFANPTSRFVGHAVCDSPEWLNGLSNPISESYHPNRPGHSSGYAPLVSPLLTGASARTTPTSYGARVPAAQIAASQRRYAAADSRIEPETFRVPDLTTRAARVAARRAGIDIDRWLARH